MSREIAVNGATLTFDNGSVRIERNRQVVDTLSMTFEALMILAAVYSEMLGRKVGNKATKTLVCGATELSSWIATIIWLFKSKHGSVLPLPYRLYFLPGETAQFGKLRLRNGIGSGPDDSFLCDDQVTIFNADGSYLSQVSEGDLALLLNSAAIELLGPLWQKLGKKPEPTAKAQQSPGFTWISNLMTSRGLVVALTWMLFRPVIWFRSLWRRSKLKADAKRFSSFLTDSLSAVTNASLAVGSKVQALREEVAAIEVEKAAHLESMDRERLLLLQAQQKLAADRAAMERTLSEERVRQEQKLAEIRTELERASASVSVKQQKLDQLQLDYDRLKRERDNFFRALQHPESE